MFHIVKYRDYKAMHFITDKRDIQVFTFTENCLRVLGENCIKTSIKLTLRDYGLEQHLNECLKCFFRRV